VNNFAVARTGLGADGGTGFQNQHFATGQCQRTGNGQAHNARTYDDAIQRIGHKGKSS
jgi:hypothetical protein